ncbi:brain protein I3-like isoform X2 [Amphibalanus amphitrite]|uniref:brain protein I3-like isoform X1 n=1 Tax=Amphibalanus amphitrite TaxID=1232801 RepID=UPI001C91BFD5|nr:brain protein I3-like isoform X1 [Amphibalanus amphitrite]XP_043242683.1 brain protein I3-like isoform X2 [Amphibalanus amphitrite]
MQAPPPAYAPAPPGQTGPGVFQQAGAAPPPPPPPPPGGPAGFMMAPMMGMGQQQQQQQQQSTTNSSSTTVVVAGGGGGGGGPRSPFLCPVCQTGVMETSYTFCGVLLAIVLFPIGIICCLYLSGRTCSACGYSR